MYCVTTQNGLLSPLHWSPVALYDVQVMSSTVVYCHHLPPMRLHPITTSEVSKIKPSSLGPLDMTSVYRQVLNGCMAHGYARGQTWSNYHHRSYSVQRSRPPPPSPQPKPPITTTTTMITTHSQQHQDEQTNRPTQNSA